MPKVCIIILNWNCWQDTIECIESVLRLDYPNYYIIICDNASEDNSLKRIAEWARGSLRAGCANPELQNLTFPPCPKPIPFLSVDPGEQVPLGSRPEKLFLVQTGANLGFAGGNNVGLRLALATNDLDYVWLLNNDTVVDKLALSNLVRTMEERPSVGICGSTLMYYRRPYIIQTQGGCRYNRWFARMCEVGLGTQYQGTILLQTVEKQLDYISGASMLVRRQLIEDIGLMNEEYFLYFEEIDWATRSKGRYTLAYCPHSFVYHKDGGSTGTAGDVSRPKTRLASPLSEFYTARNRIFFTARYYKTALPSVILAVVASGVQRLVRRRWLNCVALFRGLMSGLSMLAAHSIRYLFFCSSK